MCLCGGGQGLLLKGWGHVFGMWAIAMGTLDDERISEARAGEPFVVALRACTLLRGTKSAHIERGERSGVSTACHFGVIWGTEARGGLLGLWFVWFWGNPSQLEKRQTKMRKEKASQQTRRRSNKHTTAGARMTHLRRAYQREQEHVHVLQRS